MVVNNQDNCNMTMRIATEAVHQALIDAGFDEDEIDVRGWRLGLIQVDVPFRKKIN